MYHKGIRRAKFKHSYKFVDVRDRRGNTPLSRASFEDAAQPIPWHGRSVGSHDNYLLDAIVVLVHPDVETGVSD